MLYTCLFAQQGTDLRETLRGGHSDDRLRELIAGIWSGRRDRYSELRAAGKSPQKIEMSYIGG